MKTNENPVHERQRNIINPMLEDDFEGHMNTSKYAKLAKCSTDTALRDIQDLVTRGIFVLNSGGGRSTSYRLTDLTEELVEIQEIRPLDSPMLMEIPLERILTETDGPFTKSFDRPSLPSDVAYTIDILSRLHYKQPTELASIVLTKLLELLTEND